MAASHKDMLKKINEMEKKYDHQFQLVFEAIKALMKEEEKPKRAAALQYDGRNAPTVTATETAMHRSPAEP